MARLQDVLLRGVAASQPAATDVATGTIYFATDTEVTTQSDGSNWQTYGPATIGNVAGQAASIDSEIALFSGTGGKTIKRATGTGVVHATSGVYSVGTVAISEGGTGQTTQTAGMDALSPTTTKGDLLADNGTNVVALAAGTNGYTLVADSAQTAGLKYSPRVRVIGIVIDGGGSTITTGVKGYVQVPVSGTLTEWTILADQSGAIKIDVWKDTFANFPPDNSDSITNGHEPEITASGTNANDNNIADWTSVTVTAGDVIGFNVDSCTSITRATLEIYMTQAA